jgi:protein SCO1/2
MDRRDFLGMSLVPLLLSTPAAAALDTSRPMSRLARQGMLPNVPLITHNNQSVRFYDDLIRDKTVLLNFFLVQCTDGKCPIAMANLRKVQDMLGDRMGRDVFFVSITLQPLFDRPDKLKDYAENVVGAKPGWDFITGKPSDVDLLRRSLGFVDSDPERDKDLTNHTGMARYGNDRLERWGMVSLRSSPANIASTFKWLTV